MRIATTGFVAECGLVLMALFALAAHGAHAADAYPTKSVRLIVPFPPGGTTDILARALGTKLSESLGQAVIVENRPGAGGNIGAELVAKAPPDGYTLLLGTPGPLAINTRLYKNLPFDPAKDFTAVGQIVTVPSVLVVAADSPYQTVADVIKDAKAKPGNLMYASPGKGTTPHLAAELLKSMAGIDLQHVAYKGDAPAMQDVMGHQVPIMMANVAGVIAQVKSGRLRALAVSGPKRSALLPDVPTLAESGVRDYNVTAWAGVVGPAGLPEAVVARLNAEIGKVMGTPDLHKKMEQLSAEVATSTPAQFASLIRTEQARWGKVIADAKVSLE